MQKEFVLRSFRDLKKATLLLKSSIESYKPYDLSKEYSIKIAHAYLPEELKDIYDNAVKIGSEIVKKVQNIEAKLSDLLK